MTEHRCTWAFDESDINRTIFCEGLCGRTARIRLDGEREMVIDLQG